MDNQAIGSCQHQWCPFACDSTRFWCYRCRGKTTLNTLYVIDAIEREQEREVTVEISLEYA